VSGLLPPESGGLQETVPLLVCSRDQGRKSVEHPQRERERERERSAYFQYIYTYIQNVHPSSIVGIFSFDQEIENSREVGDNNVPGTFSSSPSFTCAESNHAILTPYLN
jgi:hypothetical protein